MSMEETKPGKGRIEERNTEKEFTGADDGMMKPQIRPSSSSQLSFLQEEGEHKKEMGAVSGDATMSTLEHIREFLKKSESIPREYLPEVQDELVQHNENALGSLEGRTEALNQVMEALADPTTHIVGFHCSNENAIKVNANFLQRVTRRAERDNMFEVILKATITNKPNIKKIQDEIAGGLNLKLDEKSTAKRASLLLDSIKMKQKILVMLCELCNGIDLGKIGIPYGADHTGCKILLTSTSEDVLSIQMHTQKNFSV